MNRLMKQASAVLLIAFVAGLSSAQQTTERYIPIGESPGVSMSQSVVGTISSVDASSHQMTINSDGSSTTVTLTTKTLYYLDRSHAKRSNGMGGYEDCEIGRMVEVKANEDGAADWVKIKSP